MKAILVIDKPESCTSCMLGIYNKRWFCLATNEDINITDRYNIPKSCPLKPMPQKNEIKNEEEFMNVCGWMFEVQTGMDIGWNDCIDELVGETE